MNDYDNKLDKFGRELVAASATSPSWQTRLGSMAPIVSIGAIAAVCGAAAIALLVSIGGAGERLDFTARAQAALAPRGKIIHVVVRISQVRQPGYHGPAMAPETWETWSAANPPRWRFAQNIAKPSKGHPTIVDDSRHIISGRLESAYAHGVQQTYEAGCDQLTVTRGFHDDGPAADVPTPFGIDPIAQLRQMLADGELRDRGRVNLASGPARRLVGFQSRRPIRRMLTFVIDEQTFTPISVTQETSAVGAPRAERTVTSYVVARFERLDDSPETAKLLRIATTTPRTRIVYRNAKLTSKQKKQIAMAHMKRGPCAP